METSCAYCLNTSTIRPAPLLDKIRIAAAAGFEAVELWSDDIDAFVASGGTLAEVRRAIDDAGLALPTVIALHGWLGSSGAARTAAITEATRRMEQAAALGAKRIVASPPREPFDLSTGGSCYRELLELGDGIGIAPAMEFLGFAQSVFTIEQAWQIICEADHPAASIVMDPFHILRGGGDPSAIALVPGERVAIWHWNDLPADPPFEAQTDADRVLPGDGIAPLAELERLVRESGYTGFVSLEVFHEGLWGQDPERVAVEGGRKMDRYFRS